MTGDFTKTQLKLTWSVAVINFPLRGTSCHGFCKVTLTGYQTLKHSNHLITISLYRDRDKALAHRDGKYCAIPGGPPGQFHALQPGQSTGGLRRVTQTPSTAVPLWASLSAKILQFKENKFGPIKPF